MRFGSDVRSSSVGRPWCDTCSRRPLLAYWAGARERSASLLARCAHRIVLTKHFCKAFHAVMQLKHAAGPLHHEFAVEVADGVLQYVKVDDQHSPSPNERGRASLDHGFLTDREFYNL